MPAGAQPLVARMRDHATTVFAEYSALALSTGSVNLGQGFPDVDGPAVLVELAARHLRDGPNQYAPSPGVPELRTAVADHQRERYGIAVDPDAGVLVTVGATEAIAAAVLALCEPGDEVVVLDPAYDAYPAVVALAGARLRPVPLVPPRWELDADVLRAAVSPRTRAVLVNTPHNPTGRVLSHDELAVIAAVCCEHDLVAITDEVYEHLVFEGRHVPLASLPGMAERTLTVSSIGKTFSFTGWKVGWVSGPSELVAAVRAVKQYLTFASPAPLQLAAAAGLRRELGWAGELARDLRARRDLLCDGLASLGFDVLRPQATYFATTDVRSIGEGDGEAFCRELPHRCRVVALPSVVFHADRSAGRPFVRWAFCKRPEVLAEALGRLASGLSSRR